MATKSTSPQAAQKKLWKAEIRALQANRKKVLKDCAAELRQSQRNLDAATKTASTLAARHRKKVLALSKAEARLVSSIDRRIGILEGRILA